MKQSTKWDIKHSSAVKKGFIFLAAFSATCIGLHCLSATKRIDRYAVIGADAVHIFVQGIFVYKLENILWVRVDDNVLMWSTVMKAAGFYLSLLADLHFTCDSAEKHLTRLYYNSKCEYSKKF
jgi:hypothetical protein